MMAWRGWVVVAGVVFAGLAVAGPGRQEEPPDPAAGAARMQTQLGLDDATRDAIEAILTEAQAEAGPIRAQAESLSAEVKVVIETRPRDWKRIDKLVHQVADARADGFLLRLKTMDEIEGLLTAEQVAKFKALRAEREAQHGPPGGLGDGL